MQSHPLYPNTKGILAALQLIIIYFIKIFFKMRKLYIFSLLVVLVGLINAQTLTVLDKEFLSPIPNVEIYSYQPKESTITNQNGMAEISLFKNSDSIYFNTVGYQRSVYSFTQLEMMGYKVYLTVKSYDLNTIVVSASRFEEKMTDVPQQIQVMPKRQLEFFNSPTSSEMIEQSGNVLSQKSQLGGGSPIIRGFEANKVLLVVDGVRMNNAIYRGGHLQNIITMDNSMLEKTEIVYGPGSVIYGSDALGGVIHFYTKNPLLSDTEGKVNIKANAYSRYSSAYNEMTGHVDFNIGLKKFASLTSFTYSNFDDLRQGNVRNPFYGDWGKRIYYADRINGKDTMMLNNNVNIQKPSGYKQYDLLEKLLFKQSNKISHILNIQYSTSSDIPRYDRLTDMSNGQLKNAEWYYGPQDRLFIDYNLDLKADRGIYENARVSLAYQAIEESRHNRSFGKNGLSHRIENVQVYTLNADLNKTIKSNELRYGIEATYNDVKSKANKEDIVTGASEPLDTRYPNGGSNMTSLAAYITHTLEINPKLILNDGLRYSYVSLDSKFIDKTFYPFPFDEVTQKSGSFNGKLGLIAMPGLGWRFTGMVSTGYRVPNVDDMTKVFESAPGNVIVPNPDLKPEYTYNGEIGISKVFDEKIRVEGIGYYTYYDNVITTQKSTFNGQDSILYDGSLSQVMTSVNANSAYIYGFSGSLSADITHSFSIVSTLNYTYGRINTDTTDYPLDHIAPVFGRTSFNLTIKKFRGEFFVVYNGWKRIEDYNLVGGEDNESYATEYGTPAWCTLNLRTAYQVNKYLQVQVALENILDQNYRVFASGISAPGRNFVLTLRGRF
jgi:hemoglobin/transferrin/lactoferrin receptor protein